MKHTRRTLIHERVELARAGNDPALVGRLSGGWLVFGERQPVTGYCLLLPDPVVPSVNEMPRDDQAQFLDDMVRVGDALLECTEAWRVNYEILGNAEPALHAHIFPRYREEPDDHRRRPVWSYDWERVRRFDPAEDGSLMKKLASALDLE